LIIIGGAHITVIRPDLRPGDKKGKIQEAASSSRIGYTAKGRESNKEKTEGGE
jgi:hypothetical protein